MLDDLDLVHMNGRVYEPTIGRFISADPHVTDPTNGQNLNRYSYVLNSPLNYTDPTGFDQVVRVVGERPMSQDLTFYATATRNRTLPVPQVIIRGKASQAIVSQKRLANSGVPSVVGSKSAAPTDGSTLGELDIPKIVVQGYRQAMTTFADNNRGIFGWEWAVGLVDRNIQRPDNSAESKVASVAILALSLRSPKGAEEALAKTVRKTSKIDRAAFKVEREAFWKREVQENAAAYSPADLERMSKGRAPIGPDGYPMELHHVDRTPEGGIVPMSRTDHRLAPNYKLNHPND